MSSHLFQHLTDENISTIEQRREFLLKYKLEPELFWPFLRPCDVRILIVTDGGLDFSEGGFGLSVFVRSLLDMPGRHVRFRITLAHIGNASATQMMSGEPRIVNRITQFKFDDPAHFKPDMYHEVFLFGIAVSTFGRGTASNGQPYPSDRLADPELVALTQHMNGGGGLFATGDHGSLGRFLCASVPRARNMRLWASTSAQNAEDEVSMNGQRRNDTNRLGHDNVSSFDDQSDDVPQTIQPRLYSRRNGFFRYTFPHPLLCGPNGVIRVMPDHPHEGECVAPANTNLNLNIGGPLGPEYPPAAGGGAKPVPEVIAWSTVLSGTTSSGKAPTLSQTFGGICAYDGHRAKIGRVVTDATWHHFVNINLTGDTGAGPGNPKQFGFLASAQGQAHLENIRAYFRNLAVWLVTPERIKCMNTRLSWTLVWSDKVMEAVLSTTDIKVVEVQPAILALIGKHARDVLGRFAGQCQSVRIVLDLVLARAVPKLIPEIDPWLPEIDRSDDRFDGVEWFDASPIIDIAFGAALTALREAIPQPDEKIARELDADKLADIMAEGGKAGVEMAIRSLQGSARLVASEIRL